MTGLDRGGGSGARLSEPEPYRCGTTCFRDERRLAPVPIVVGECPAPRCVRLFGHPAGARSRSRRPVTIALRDLESPMTTARDLSIVAADPGIRPAVEQGDLSLALAGAELVDLLDSGTVSLDGDRLVPWAQPPPDDAVLREAVTALLREAPYETVEEWLWRRGRGLAARYRETLEAEGLVAPRAPAAPCSAGLGRPRRTMRPRAGGRRANPSSGHSRPGRASWTSRTPRPPA
ncbi:hypothetical protein SHKM778_44450 [Streptomyces sp. KM77-8]|uniref:GPP34 family phosphoprotein n=1 Tax=Streptomyces haneummycinicus TaxID=3074435 RepID=A0AAT9HKV4_9ACTN